MNNPIEICQKIKEGCGEEISKSYSQIDVYCGDTLQYNKVYCKSCEATLTAKKEEWQKFLERLEKYLKCNDGDELVSMIIEDEKEYKKAVSIANG